MRNTKFNPNPNPNSDTRKTKGRNFSSQHI